MTHPHTIIRGPEYAVACTPFLLGFQPEHSLVAIWVRDGMVVLTQRVDLPPAHDDQRDFAAAFIRQAGHAHADSVVMLVYASSEAFTVQPELVDALLTCVDDLGLDVLDILVVNGDRFTSCLCEDCCPDEGRVVTREVRDEVAATFAFAGIAAMPSRDDLVASLRPDPSRMEALLSDLESEAEALAVAEVQADAVERWRDACIVDVVRLFEPGPDISTAQLARLVHGVVDIRVRDTVAWTLACLEDRHAALEVLMAGLRAAPPGLVAPIATCTAMCAWFVGDGARASIAVERALDDDPDYQLALMIDQAIQAGLPPGEWAQALRDMPQAELRRRAPAA